MMRAAHSSRKTLLLFAGFLAAAFAASLLSGRVSVDIAELAVFAADTLDKTDISPDLAAKSKVFFWIRLPRCIMAVMVGAGLAASGAVFQALFRNPLVSPNILGVSAGCTFGAALGLTLPVDGFMFVNILSFLFGLLAVSMSAGLAKAISVKPVIVLVLAGMIVLSFFNALLMILKYFSDPYDELPSIVFWVMGSLTRVTWEHVLVTGAFTTGGLIIFLLLRFNLNIASLGDIQAKSLGMNPAIFRLIMITTSSFVVAVSVATCGQISWIGLIVPHMARTLAGPRHENMLPLTALMGGLFLLIADSLARSVSTAEIPVGIITALAGAPVFGYLLYRNRGAGWL